MKLFGAKNDRESITVGYFTIFHPFSLEFPMLSKPFPPRKTALPKRHFLFAAVFASNVQSQEWRETHQLSASCCSDAGLLVCTTCRHSAGRPGQPFPMMNIMPRRMDFQSVFFRTDWKSILRASSRGTTIAPPPTSSLVGVQVSFS